jgi:hypothetical protein
MRSRALRQVSGNRNHVRPDLIGSFNQWTNDRGINATEMNIRKMSDGSHYSSRAI